MYTDPCTHFAYPWYKTLIMPYERAISICCILFWITNTDVCSSNDSHYRLWWAWKQSGCSWLFQVFRCLYCSKSFTPLRAKTCLFNRLLMWICKWPESYNNSICINQAAWHQRESVCMFPGRVCSLDFGLWHCCGCWRQERTQLWEVFRHFLLLKALSMSRQGSLKPTSASFNPFFISWKKKSAMILNLC